jgi:hypothetical protein
MAGDMLYFDVSYFGGCAEHEFRLCYGPELDESSLFGVTLQLIHDAHGDVCESAQRTTIGFDLTPLAEAYKRVYPSNGGLINTNSGPYVFGNASCDERRQSAVFWVDTLNSPLPHYCRTDADCGTVSLNTRCASDCSVIASARDEGGSRVRSDIAAGVDAIDQFTCGPWVAQDCERSPAAVCTPLRTPLACVENLCREAP